MTESLQEQIRKLQQSIQGLDAQRSILGDDIVNPALAALQQQLSGLEQQSVEQTTPTEERRMVTILFMDLVGSTSMAEKLDPEEWRQIVSKMHTTLGGVITAHQGSVAQYLGDGLLAFFGSKIASENDPENAIRAALDGHAAVANLPGTEKLLLRMGIHTGLVVVGELGAAEHREFTASGDAMNLAARLQSAAPPGGTLISFDTYRYVRGVFEVIPQLPLSVKGKSEPLQTYLVRRAKPRPFRSPTRGVAGIETRTVGREAEMQALQAAYLRAFEGHGTVWAQLVGDPGVGKSRLISNMLEWMDLRDESFRLLRARAFPDDANQPYALIRRMWFDRFQIAFDAPLEQAETKWVERFKELSCQEEGEEAAHALGLLTGLSFENSPYTQGMRNDPTQLKGRALVVSRELVNAVRQEYPLVVLLEDLQSIDLSSWEYLVKVFLDGSNMELPNGVFILGAARPEWQPPVELVSLFEGQALKEESSKIDAFLIDLAPLSDENISELTHELFQRTAGVPQHVVDLIVERSEGVPYFTEEMINWLIDHEILDTKGESWLFREDRLKSQPLPATLQHLLLTRLSSLSQAERTALQRGAIFGRRFWSGGLEALDVPSAQETVNSLQPRGFVDVQPESVFQGETEWSFKQNLLQEVTYESVLKRERIALHKVAAGWLERQARQAERLDEFAGLLGEHCERAGELSAAVDWYMMAGKLAFAQGAPREARGFYTLALNLLPPVDRERRWQALLGREQALKILSDAEPWKADTNALLELARTFEDQNYLAEAYLRQARFSMLTGDWELGRLAGEEAILTAQKCGNEAIEAKALALTAVISIAMGDQISRSQDNIEKALLIARRLGDAGVLSLVVARAAYYFGNIGNLARFYPLLTEQIELAHSLGDRSVEANGMENLGSAYLGLGLYKQARQLLDNSFQIFEALGDHRSKASVLESLGELYLATGDLRKSHQLVEQSLQEISQFQNAGMKIFYLFRSGLVLMEMDDPSSAYRRFLEAHQLSADQNIPVRIAEIAGYLAACAVMLGQLDEARKFAHETWDFLTKEGWFGMVDPLKTYRILSETFDALGEAENAHIALEKGYQVLMKLADSITEPAWRKSFLENNPDARAILEMWERRKSA